MHFATCAANDCYAVENPVFRYNTLEHSPATARLDSVASAKRNSERSTIAAPVERLFAVDRGIAHRSHNGRRSRTHAFK